MFDRIMEPLLAMLALIGTLAVVLLTLHVGIGVVLRTGFDVSIPATYEIVTQYYMIALAFVPVAWVERKGGMVAVELIDTLLPQRIKAGLDRLVALFSTLVYGALAWFTWVAAVRNWRTGTFALIQDFYLPLWPGYFLVPLGFGVAALVTALRLMAPARPATP